MGALRIIIYRMFCFLFRIRRNRILFFSYYGQQYGCNPKYLSEYLVANCKELDVVWAFTQKRTLGQKSFKQVRYGGIDYIYMLATTRFIVTNYRLPLDFPKRKGQVYIQTWHSSLRLKTIEKDAQEYLPQNYIEQAKVDSSKIDILISGCGMSTKTFKNSFWYDGFVLESGTPRIDALMDTSRFDVAAIRRDLGIPIENRILLYAPTFRQSKQFDGYLIDFSEIKKTLSQKFGGSWSIMVRLHPHMVNDSDLFIDRNQSIDVTNYDDIQELLGITDFLISDYSSLIFDYAFRSKPILLYIPDIDNYLSKERKLYFDIPSLPFLKCKTVEQIVQNIAGFENETYQNELADFNDRIQSFEKGDASEFIANHIKGML